MVMRIPPVLAPVRLAVFPLIKKDGLPEVAQGILKDLRLEHNCIYDEKDSIGKRYRRMDAIGTPFCITVDHQDTGRRHRNPPGQGYHVAGTHTHGQSCTYIG